MSVTLGTLPPEVLLHAFHGLQLEDVHSISRVSRYFRSVCQTYPEVWNTCTNSKFLFIPRGTPADTTALFQYYTRSVSLIRALNDSVSYPKRSTELSGLFKLSTWPAFWSKLGTRERPEHFLLPGGRYFILWHADGGGLYSVQQDYGYAFDLSARIVSLDWEVGEDGFVILGMLLVNYEGEIQIKTYRIEFFEMDVSKPSVKLMNTVPVPSSASFGRLKIRKSLIFLYGNGLAIVDVQSNRAICLQTNEHVYTLIRNCLFHPSLPVLLLEISTSNGNSGQNALEYMWIPQDIPKVIASSDSKDIEWPSTAIPLERISEVRIDTGLNGERVNSSVSSMDDGHGVRVDLVYNWNRNGCIWSLQIPNSFFRLEERTFHHVEPEKMNVTYKNAMLPVTTTSRHPMCITQWITSPLPREDGTYLSVRYSTFLADGLANSKPVLKIPFALSLYSEDVIAFDERSGTLLIRDRFRFLFVQL